MSLSQLYAVLVYNLSTPLDSLEFETKRMSMDKPKDQNLTIFTTEEELAHMKKHREKFVQQMGQDTYDRLVKKLEDHISSRNQPKSAAQSEL